LKLKPSYHKIVQIALNTLLRRYLLHMYALRTTHRKLIVGNIKHVKTRRLYVSVYTCLVVVLYEAQLWL
jgi:hypothetical protein